MTAIATKKPGLALGRLSAVAQIAVNKKPQPADAEIDLSLIYSVKQVRTMFRGLDELAESIKLNGIIEPLVVHEEADGRYRIIVGERRFRAVPLVGLTKVPVIIKRGCSELEIRRMQVAENNNREDLSAFDQAMGVIEDVELYGIEEARRIWNKPDKKTPNKEKQSEGWISKRIAITRYAEPVLGLLKDGLCEDFEVLHCLNQIYDIEDSHTEFLRLSHRLSEGLPLSREEARNTLARMKTWKQQQEELAQRRQKLEKAPKSKKAPEKTPKWLEDQRKGDAERAAVKDDSDDQDEADQPTAPASAYSGQQTLGKMEQEQEQDQKEAAEKQRAGERLLSLRKEAFKRGEVNKEPFLSMKTHMSALGHGMHQTEWVLWHGFLAMTLPMLEGIGPERASMYLKKLQGELKDKTPMQLWEKLHPDIDGAGRDDSPDMPESWRF